MKESLISCRCGACRENPHASDCAVHNAPAFPAGPCDCPTGDRLFTNDDQTWDEWVGLFSSRDEMAEQYALELSRSTAYTDVFWANINAAIIRRWSLAALSYIKREAWRIHPNRVARSE